jgi:hypothetical protein
VERSYPERQEKTALILNPWLLMDISAPGSEALHPPIARKAQML